MGRRLAGVSQKMLTQTLRSLERDGLITRTVTPTVPVTVTYELTDLGAPWVGPLGAGHSLASAPASKVRTSPTVRSWLVGSGSGRCDWIS